MDKDFSISVLTEVQGTSPSYVVEYGLSIVRESLRYLERLKVDEKTKYMMDDVWDLVHRVRG